ncbi:MAG TPA: DNA mismatch repair endonuclease MutL, partial [Tepidisphaeraceae bacterium]|nr:DNA mismatch repair endonuclease MutL [Tepidisphaeraceae bacterium]
MVVQDDRFNNSPARPGAIRQLPPSLVNRIAAGEVIERPASVVKELLENAIDAGATHITVEIEDGGRELIRVIDDGSGIWPQDLPLAFASHATSKLHDDQDLFRITTLGFRGEALASIGAVSHCRILSRPADPHQQAAWEIHNRGGQITDPQAAAGNVGTTVEVRNLFYNVPARRKFLKGPATEFGHIAEMLLRCALPRPDISFRLLHNGRMVLDLPASTEQQRLLCAWPQEFHEQRLPLDCRDAEIRLRGIIGLPELARPTARYQHLYLNNRPIRDKFIQHALREAYRGLTEPGRYPAAILLIDMPPEDVDVNVHPTKAEVRFRDGQRIHGLVMAAVRERLLGSDLTPRVIARAATPDDQERKDMQTRLAEFFRAAPVNPSTWVPQLAGGATAPSLSPPRQAHPPTTAAQAGISHPPPPANHAVGSDTRSPTSPQLGPGFDAPAGASHPASHNAATPARPASAIQLHNSYLVAESEDGLIIIDQHALHERIMFEELKARITRGPLESQRLLVPQTLAASTRQIALLEQIQPLLRRLGIEAEPFGPDTVAVHAFPSFLERLDPAEFVGELLERGEQELLDLHEEELLHEVLDMMACKAAVKAGDPLTP